MPDTKPLPTTTPERRSTAVAIKHDGTAPRDDAARPQVVAKGQGAVAEQILQLAFATGVKVRQDADLIEVLEAIEIDSEIPISAMATVAEILSYLYRVNAAQASAAEPTTQPKNENENP